MTTEEQKRINYWRNERCERAQFKTQQQYDEMHETLKQLREMYTSGQMTHTEVWLELVKVHLYGETAAKRVIDLWEEKYVCR